MKQRRGALWAVGIGIRAPSQATLEASERIKRSDMVFSLVADPLAEYWIRSLNPTTESLAHFYARGKARRQTYREMVERIMDAVRRDLRVCVVAYGHPGIVAYPLHEALRRAHAEGFPAEMLPGVSAENCLFAELGIDPAVAGWHCYEATEFLVHRRTMDPSSNLVLWQVGGIAVSDSRTETQAWNRDGIVALTERLLEAYRPQHEVVVYEAASLPVCRSTVERVALQRLPDAPIRVMATLYVPPMTRASLDETMMRRLGITQKPRAPAALAG
ncbi:MAG: hypothetical protein JO043_04900 [Candidatus Eremiobacteraeota bacterium]|nr:hypothetical protein [Candidatus Eremiobacteraeota bacterium]